MAAELTTSQINRLGERLRKAQPRAADQETLDAFRRSFNDALQKVVHVLRDLGLQPTERIKTTFSIVQKLNRESIRLSRLQDIAGCRVVVDGIARQDHFAKLIVDSLPKAMLIDRREKPTHGYRAVHIVAEIHGRLVEIQLRTQLQQLWAAWSELLATAVDQAVKYGGGPEGIRRMLSLESRVIATLESKELRETFGKEDSMSDLDLLAAQLSGITLASEVINTQRFDVDVVLNGCKIEDFLIHEILGLKNRRQP
jgi:ppGpp synthetase/RelA/SpoT-type nucleotidyltranferase